MALRLLATSLALLFLCSLAACGSGSSGSTREGTTTVQGAADGGDTSIQRYGTAVAGSERKEAAMALHGYLDARAAGVWADACDQLAKGVTEQLASYPGKGSTRKPNCHELLARLYKAVPRPVLREGAVAEVGSFRVAGKRGFLIFQGADSAYFVPMYREGGAWRVAAIAPSALP